MTGHRVGDHETLVVFYSRTGTTETVAKQLASTMSNPAVEVIRPDTERRYLNWLCRSFVPGWGVDIEPPSYDPRDYDAVFLGTPKWTVNCPPVTAYLSAVSLDEVAVGLFMTYGGFDQERYARALSCRLARAGAKVPARLLVQRDRATPVPTTALERFRDAVLAGDAASPPADWD